MSSGVLIEPWSSRIARPEGVWMRWGRGLGGAAGEEDLKGGEDGRRWRVMVGSWGADIVVCLVVCWEELEVWRGLKRWWFGCEV